MFFIIHYLLTYVKKNLLPVSSCYYMNLKKDAYCNVFFLTTHPTYDNLDKTQKRNKQNTTPQTPAESTFGNAETWQGERPNKPCFQAPY